MNLRSVFVFLLFTMATMSSGCAKSLPQGARLAAVMPESTRAVLAVRLPKSRSDGTRPIFDEAAIHAHMGMADGFRRVGAFCVTMLIEENGEEDWQVVGLTEPLRPVPGGELDFHSAKVVFARLSVAPIDGAESGWERLMGADETRLVATVEGVPIYHMKDSPDMIDERVRADGAYVALVDRRLLLASFEQDSLEEAVRRSRRRTHSFPGRLQAVGAQIPKGAESYLLSSHQNVSGGMSLPLSRPPLALRAQAFAICDSPTEEMAFRFIVAPANQSDLEQIEKTLAFWTRVSGSEERIATVSIIKNGDARYVEIRFLVDVLRASYAGMGVIMALSDCYSLVLCDLSFSAIGVENPKGQSP